MTTSTCQGVTGVLAGSDAPARPWRLGPAWFDTREVLRRKWFHTGPRSSRQPGLDAAGRVQAWVIGPGLGTGHAESATLRAVLATDLPVIVDADALTILSRHFDLVSIPVAPTVLTPHAGEFERLTGQPPGADRVAAARLADDLGATVLLKGNVTVIAGPGGPVYLI